jgi:hypothetical protein
MSKVRLNIVLTPKQVEVDRSPARFKIWKAGRRGAKTWYQAYFLAKNAITMPMTKHWYVTKTLALGREEIWPVILNLLPSDLVRKIDERLLTVWLTNGSSISLKSGEKEDNLRGRGLGSVVLDEAAFLKEMLWDRILRPQLAGSRGPALIASSPKKGWFTRLFNDVVKNPHQDWAAFHSTIYDNPHISKDEIEVIRAKTPESTWLQEYMAQEISDDGQVYEEFSKACIYNPSNRFLQVKSFPSVRGMDWGTHADAACGFIGVSAEGYLVISAEHSQPGWDVERHAEAIKTKSAGYTDIRKNVLDRSAVFRKDDGRISIGDRFKANGIPCEPSEKDLSGSIDIVKRFMRGDGQTPWLYVSQTCEKTISAFETWEHGDHEPDIAAAVRYGIAWTVIKKLTKLADHFPTLLRPAREDMRLTDNQLLAMGKAPRTKSRASGFSWDHEAGAFA